MEKDELGFLVLAQRPEESTLAPVQFLVWFSLTSYFINPCFLWSSLVEANALALASFPFSIKTHLSPLFTYSFGLLRPSLAPHHSSLPSFASPCPPQPLQAFLAAYDFRSCGGMPKETSPCCIVGMPPSFVFLCLVFHALAYLCSR